MIDLEVNFSERNVDVQGFEMAGALKACVDMVDPFAMFVAGVSLDAHFVLRDEDVFAKSGDEAVAGKLANAIPAFGGAREDFDDDCGVEDGVFWGIGILKATANHHDVGEKIGSTLCDL